MNEGRVIVNLNGVNISVEGLAPLSVKPMIALVDEESAVVMKCLYDLMESTGKISLAVYADLKRQKACLDVLMEALLARQKEMEGPANEPEF